MYFCPLSPTKVAFPHVLLSSGIPCIPNPILESQVMQSFWPFSKDTNSCPDIDDCVSALASSVKTLSIAIDLQGSLHGSRSLFSSKYDPKRWAINPISNEGM